MNCRVLVPLDCLHCFNPLPTLEDASLTTGALVMYGGDNVVCFDQAVSPRMQHGAFRCRTPHNVTLTAALSGFIAAAQAVVKLPVDAVGLEDRYVHFVIANSDAIQGALNKSLVRRVGTSPPENRTFHHHQSDRDVAYLHGPNLARANDSCCEFCAPTCGRRAFFTRSKRDP
jgi:hypothetical protein